MTFVLTNIKNIVLADDNDNLYVDDNFSKLFKSYLGVYNFISSMIEETKHCSDILTKNL